MSEIMVSYHKRFRTLQEGVDSVKQQGDQGQQDEHMDGNQGQQDDFDGPKDTGDREVPAGEKQDREVRNFLQDEATILDMPKTLILTVFWACQKSWFFMIRNSLPLARPTMAQRGPTSRATSS